jgi:hypothetical protein
MENNSMINAYKSAVWNFGALLISVSQVVFDSMSDEEFAKIPIVAMSPEEKSVFIRYGLCFIIYRGAKEYWFYSMGRDPFIIKTIETPQPSTNGE